MQSIIQQIHDTEGHFELAVTGGGTSAISELLAVAGASRSLLNAVVPYSSSALQQYLGASPVSACSSETARLLATRAFHNARDLCNTRVIGIGATAALQTDRTRRGKDEIFVAVQRTDATHVFHLSLSKDQSRSTQEQLCTEFIIQIIAASFEIKIPGAPVAVSSQIATGPWQALMCGERLIAGDSHYRAIFPGAFNPPHEGHFQMRAVAEHFLGTPVAFEISAFNVDKPPLDYIALEERQRNLKDSPMVFTHAAKFIEKAALFPGATFVVGVDTLIRIDDAKYYGDSEFEKHAAIETFANGGHRFLVFGRVMKGSFHHLNQIEISPALRALCMEIPESEFRQDISSTEIRNQS